MTKLSPADALGPAFRRVREVMAAPFRLGFFLKIALVAALTQPGFYSVIITYPLQGVQAGAGAAIRHRTPMSFADTGANGLGFIVPGAVAGFVVVAIILGIGLVVWILSTYLFCRLRFTLFDLIVYRRGRVREAWGKYGRKTWRYFGVVLLASLVCLILLAVTAGPFFIRMIKEAARLGAHGPNPNANPWPVLAPMLPFLGVSLLIGLLWMVIDAVLQDFVVPQIAIDDAPIEGAFSRFLSLLREDFGSVVVYLLLRFVVAFGITWALMIGVFMILAVGGMSGLAVGFVLYRTMWAGGIGLRVVFVAIVAAMALVLLAVYILAMIAVYGMVAAFKESYAAYFFGSRYPGLGDLMEPPPPGEDLVAVRVEPPLPPLPPLSEPPPVW